MNQNITDTTLAQRADRLVFVHADITCWSGKRTLSPEDLGLDPARLPPESLVSLGDKQLIDPACLRVFTSIRSRARRRCLAAGARFMGGYAVPEGKAQALADALAALGGDYAAARASFLANYDRQLADWADRQPPEWRGMIRQALVPAEHVGGKLRYGVHFARVRAPEAAVVDHDGFGRALSGLGDQIVAEVGQVARETLKKSFGGREAVAGQALGPLRAIRDKLDGLGFIDARFRSVVDDLDRLLAGVDARTRVGGGRLAACRQFLCLASRPGGLWDYAATAPEIEWAPAGLFGPPDDARAPRTAPAPDPAEPPETADGAEPPPETVGDGDGDGDGDTGWYFE